MNAATIGVSEVPAQTLQNAKLLLDSQGFCLLDQLIAPPTVSTLATRLAEQAKHERSSNLSGRDDAQLDQSNQYVYTLINKGDEFVDLVLNPAVLGVVSHLLGTEFLLSASDGIIAHPGGSLAPLHTDQWWMPPPVPCGMQHAPVGSINRNKLSEYGAKCNAVSPAVVCSVMWMISPFSDENGGTRLVPGSHLNGTFPDPSIPHSVKTIAACGEAGTAVVFDGRLWHSTGANRTDSPRMGIVTTYCGPQFRAMENYTIAASSDLLARRTESMLRQLLGFKVWQGYGKMDNPTDVYVDRSRHPMGPLGPRIAK
jgi:ectoine hydroxylase-related dioxygenase (phytanoyl-CoA dioxygenase family)